jgi:hypothetical protein
LSESSLVEFATFPTKIDRGIIECLMAYPRAFDFINRYFHLLEEFLQSFITKWPSLLSVAAQLSQPAITALIRFLGDWLNRNLEVVGIRLQPLERHCPIGKSPLSLFYGTQGEIEGISCQGQWLKPKR